MPAPTRDSSKLFQDLAAQLEDHYHLDGLHESDSALLFSSLFWVEKEPLLWLEPNNREAEKAAGNLRFFLPPEFRDQILVIPGSEADPYRGLSQHPEIAERRAVGLWRLAAGFSGFVVTTAASLMTRLPAPTEFLGACLQLEVGQFLPRDHLISRLQELGYVHEEPVSEEGEWALRGGIVDFFSPAHQHPVRVEFTGDEIESLREFDAGTQRSVEIIPVCQVIPMREMVVSEADLSRWTDKAFRHWNEVRFCEALEEKAQFTRNHELFNGFEYLFPLVLNHESSLLDYMSGHESFRIVVAKSDQCFQQIEKSCASYRESFEARQSEGELALSPERIFFGMEEIRRLLAEAPTYQIRQVWDSPQPSLHLDFQLERSYHGRIQELLSDLRRWLEAGERTIFVTGSSGMAERMAHLLSEYEIQAQLVSSGFEKALEYPISVVEGDLSQGFYSPGLGLHILTHGNVFDQLAPKPPVRKQTPQELASRFLSDFRDLRPGDFVVHLDHGIGVFQGLKRLGVGPSSDEFMVVAYRGDSKLYIPIDRLNLIQKYSGAGSSAPQVDRLGGASWEKTKTRIKKSMRDLAEDLLKLYARREVVTGHAFSEDDELMEEFERAFDFEETEDQVSAIRDVKADMESERPMDRLICGDVGYGKTEVAMRAAFKAVNDGKQVAVLAPTTVLVFQHFGTFRDRCQGFPVSVEMVSRFQSRPEQKEVLKRVASGEVDVLIGTHRLLSRDVKFKDLGLIVVDEEQRFGVAQKERFKKLKTKVDALALSATPIPRTLNMSLTGVRDLSIIETPPRDRLSIQTVVVKSKPSVIRSAIDLELRRQGQVLFVHNSVESIYSVAEMIRQITPDARIGVAHGQMKGVQLEEVMLKFVGYEYDILVATTIIENGLDIPRANTLIVNRADHFGLAQLYQLRGRVGRSSRRAYAYFLTPGEKEISLDASKRLSVIKEFSDLGVGFRIAAFDLEIRGAGNLLGGEQHGHISSVGFDLYLKLLEQSIQEVKGEEVVEEVQPSIDLQMDLQIPEHYIDDPNQRLWVYKRISGVSKLSGIASLKEEVVDRFGKYPSSVSNLFECAEIRSRAADLKILSVERQGSRLLLRFREDTPISRENVIKLASREKSFSLTPEGVIIAPVSLSPPSRVFSEVHALLDNLAVLE